MHSRTPVGLLRPGIIKDHIDTGEITRMSKKRVQTGSFSDYVPLLIEAKSSSCYLAPQDSFYGCQIVHWDPLDAKVSSKQFGLGYVKCMVSMANHRGFENGGMPTKVLISLSFHVYS